MISVITPMKDATKPISSIQSSGLVRRDNRERGVKMCKTRQMDRFSLTEVDKASDGTLLAMVGLVGHEEEGKNARKRAQWKPEPTSLNIE